MNASVEKEEQWETAHENFKERKTELVQKVTLLAERLTTMKEIIQSKEAEILTLRGTIKQQQSSLDV